MNLTVLAPHDHQGGASRIAWYIFNGMRNQGIQAEFLVGKKSLDDADIHLLNGNRGVIDSLLSKLIRRINWELGRENFHFPATADWINEPVNLPDLVHGHNLQGGYFDLTQLPKLSQRVPTLLTLHDPWMFSGHCSYFVHCERWKTGCGKCPDLMRTPSVKRDATAYNWKRKKAIYDQSNLYVATPSRWLMDEAEKSMLWPSVRLARVINNGVDTSIFKPADKEALRKKHNIPSDAMVLLYVVSSRMKQNAYKDYETISEVLDILASRWSTDKKLVFLGLGQEAEEEVDGPLIKRFIPYQKRMEDIAEYYQMADLYLHAAKAENFPNVVLEALACGTPVIATRVGGVPEQIVEGKTGFVVPFESSSEMAERIMEMALKNDILKAMSQQAIDEVQKHYTLNRMVDNYVRFYEEIKEDFKLSKNER